MKRETKRMNGANRDKMRRSWAKRGGIDYSASGRGDRLTITKRGIGSSRPYNDALLDRSIQKLRGLR